MADEVQGAWVHWLRPPANRGELGPFKSVCGAGKQAEGGCAPAQAQRSHAPPDCACRLTYFWIKQELDKEVADLKIDLSK